MQGLDLGMQMIQLGYFSWKPIKNKSGEEGLVSPEKKVLATYRRHKAKKEDKAKHTVTNEMEMKMKKNLESLFDVIFNLQSQHSFSLLLLD